MERISHAGKDSGQKESDHETTNHVEEDDRYRQRQQQHNCFSNSIRIVEKTTH